MCHLRDEGQTAVWLYFRERVFSHLLLFRSYYAFGFDTLWMRYFSVDQEKNKLEQANSAYLTHFIPTDSHPCHSSVAFPHSRESRFSMIVNSSCQDRCCFIFPWSLPTALHCQTLTIPCAWCGGEGRWVGSHNGFLLGGSQMCGNDFLVHHTSKMFGWGDVHRQNVCACFVLKQDLCLKEIIISSLTSVCCRWQHSSSLYVLCVCVFPAESKSSAYWVLQCSVYFCARRRMVGVASCSAVTAN